MPMCPITKQSCIAAEYGGEACTDGVTLQDASDCIKNLRSMILDMSNEIAALDDLLEIYKDDKKLS